MRRGHLYLWGLSTTSPARSRACYPEYTAQFIGRTRELFVLEVMIFAFFIGTMLIMMMKSRFYAVGQDNSMQFEREYM